MFCTHCGKEIPEGDRFCRYCGARVDAAQSAEDTRKEQPVREERGPEGIVGKKISQNIFFCPDGKYRWMYEVNLFRNPTVMILLLKVFAPVMLGIFLFALLADACNGDLDGEAFLGALKVFGICSAVMAALIAIGYVVYALIMGGKYIVIFEMDENGILHRQLPKQAKKAEAIGLLTAMVGLATGKISTVAVGLNSTRTEMYSEFSKVRKIKPGRRSNVIKVNGLLEHNQVYASREDFDFVLQYIESAVAKAKAEAAEKAGGSK
ncbi:MAG: zinc ribbon domain-containing protein [Clostridia bacterium]|nr:zinc ribbon domain-containing protein [Clostridia bacterium]